MLPAGYAIRALSPSDGPPFKCRLAQFGMAPAYHFINGAWQDHNVCQRILRDDPGQRFD
jgi:hypothetical protein